MKVLILGSGGREHALAQTIASVLNPEHDALLVAPGNGGTLSVADNLKMPADLPAFCQQQSIDLVIIGPEGPLAAGAADALRAAEIPVFGPGAAGARLEASKVFAKEFMGRHGIPTAPYEVFDDPVAARAYVEGCWSEQGLVVKADGLAGGKGVVVAVTRQEAIGAIFSLMERRVAGEAGARVLVEPRLEGTELSILALVDGEHHVLLPPAQDHKTLFEGGRGPNTGGMGAVAPTPVVTPQWLDRIDREIVAPAVAGLAREGIAYRGVLYAGVMVTEQGPQVLEFNCRFGDPEAQVIVPGIARCLEVLAATASGRLAEVVVRHDQRVRVCVVAAAPGYPDAPALGDAIDGLDEAVMLPGVTILHAGTKLDPRRGFVTSGGRVLGVVGEGEDLAQAQERAYAAIHRISFEAGGPHFRHDIGLGGLVGVGGV